MTSATVPAARRARPAAPSRPRRAPAPSYLLLPGAPLIETERMTLRHFRRDDIRAFAKTMADPNVVRHIGGEPNDHEDAWRKLLTGAGFWSLMGIGMWAVERRSDQRLIGHLGFFDFQRDMRPSLAGEPEMGWVFNPVAHGKGYATEACEAALDWFDRTQPAASIPAIIACENAPSMRLAERLGFKRQADATYRGEPIALFRRPKQRR
ncbi:MAG: GNAT family N-acetyltransferase [Sphingomicrobium sp.]